ncbi:MAG: HNH endonuclease [Actinobacteria bacterium ATB1]|nr:HNH endonuclease [Actinobacteria bacterium ATB1]
MDPAGSDPEVGRTLPSRPTATVVAHIRVEDLQVQVASTTDCHLEAGPATSAATTRRLCCDGYTQVAAHLDDGTTVAISDAYKAIPERIRRIVRHRDRGCRFLGCGRTGFAEIHHIRHRATAGTPARRT